MHKVTRFILPLSFIFGCAYAGSSYVGKKVRCIIQNPNRVIDGIVVDEKEGALLVHSNKNNYYMVRDAFCKKIK